MKWSNRGFCNVCCFCATEYDDAEYSTYSWRYCDKEHGASNLMFFPNMKTPKNCNDFIPVWNEELNNDYWGLLHDIEYNHGVKDRELRYQILNSIITFEKAMGSYSYGKLSEH